MNIETMELLAYVSIVLLVPLLPAFIIYKSLPSSSAVSGPFKGLKINLSGGFAGYFLLVLIASSFAVAKMQEPESAYEVWTVKGSVYYLRALANNEQRKDATGVKIGILPPEYQLGSNGMFSMNVLVRPGHISSERQFPTLFFSHPAHREISINLNNSNIKVDEENKEIELVENINLEKLPEPNRAFFSR